MRFAIIPQPKSILPGEGSFTLNSHTRVEHPAEPALSSAIAAWWVQLFGSPASQDAPGNRIRLLLTDELTLADEGYTLSVTSDEVVIRARANAGLFYGIQTLRQLLPPDAEGTASPAAAWQIDAVVIEDEPRFRWRGLMLDVCRHFFPAPVIKRVLDVMALYKFNTLHLHLTEDQGWRIEIKRYPLLTEIGSRRTSSLVPVRQPGAEDFERVPDNTPYGGFFTQAELRDLIAYAQVRFINIVPEIDIPGHTVAALTCYPELGCVGHGYEVRTTWGISEDVLCVGRESTYEFVENVLDEVIALFPSPYIHIGGDECPKVRWQSCPHCQALKAREGLADEEALQSYFIRRVEKMLEARGRRLIGWDEILEGGLAPNATVMSWRGTAGGIAAASAGHDVVMSPDTHCYLDHYQSRDRKSEPPAIHGYIPLELAYAFNPTEGIAADKAHRVLGGQGNLWTEYVLTESHLQYMLFPRALALADAVWAALPRQDFADFAVRLKPSLARFDAQGIHYRKPD